jgi:transposase
LARALSRFCLALTITITEENGQIKKDANGDDVKDDDGNLVYETRTVTAKINFADWNRKVDEDNPASLGIRPCLVVDKSARLCYNVNMREKYPSDISRDAFEVIKAELLAATRPMKTRKYDIYDVFCAVLYVLKEGCTWRAIPHDFPKWQNCYYHFCVWKKQDDTGESLIDRLLRKLVISVRSEDCRAEKNDNDNCRFDERPKH